MKGLVDGMILLIGGFIIFILVWGLGVTLYQTWKRRER
jgi:hypothetical protein